MADKGVGDLVRIRAGDAGVTTSAFDPAETFGVSKKRALREVDGIRSELAALQEPFYAERSRSVLVVLQGMDTSGKDGTISHVMTGINPQGVSITSFKAPTPEERRHDFLWRIRRALPGPGLVGIFNRSHYEDVLVVKVDQLARPEVIEGRYDRINRFEANLVRSGTTVLKFCLLISAEEQRQRLVARLEDPTKHWKYSPADVDKRAQWDEYMVAYDAALSRCSIPEAPWYVVPADRKWFRNYVISNVLLETMRDLKPRYPKAGFSVARELARLPAHPATRAGRQH